MIYSCNVADYEKYQPIDNFNKAMKSARIKIIDKTDNSSKNT